MIQQISRRIYPAWLAIVVWSFVCQGSFGQTTLRWKFNAGDTWNVDFVQRIQTETRLRKKPLTTNVEMAMEMRWKIAKADAEGTADIQLSFQRVKIKMDAGEAETIEYDSASPQRVASAAKEMAAAVSSWIGGEFQMRMTSRGQILDVVLPKNLSERSKSPAAEKAKELFSKQGIQKMLGPSAYVLPAEAVVKGDSWQHTAVTQTPLGKQTLDTKFVYEGTEMDGGRALEKILINAQISYEPEQKQSPGQVKPPEFSGVLLFDNQQGRLVSSEIKQTLETERPYRDQVIRVRTHSNLSLKIAPTP